MAGTGQLQFESVVPELSEDAFGGSASENGPPLLPVALRHRAFHRAWATPSTRCWRTEPSAVASPALATFPKPITSRFSGAPGASLNAQHHRGDFPPDLPGVSPAQPMRHSVLRVAGALALVCGGSLRPLARRFAGLCLMPRPTSSRKRWLDDMGVHVPTPEEMRRPLLALAPATAGHIAGDSPRGPATGVRGGKEEPARLLLPQEAAAEHGEAARPFRPRCPARGLQGTAACAADSPSFTAARKAVSPPARVQADPFHTGKNSGGPRTKARLSSRRPSKARGAENQDAPRLAFAQQLWKLRGSRRKQPGTFSVAEQQALAEREREEEGCGQSCRPILRPRVNICDPAPSAAHAKLRLHQRRQEIEVLADRPLEQLPPFCAAHGEQAWRYRRQKGMGKPRRGSTSESGRRLRRRRENNPDGLRAAATRQHDIPSCQAIKSLSLAVANFREKGPQLVE
jgi:hypothetical protein